MENEVTNVSKLKEEAVQAHFFFICADPSKLTHQAVHDTILATFEISGACVAGQDMYDQYVAFAEDNGKARDSGTPLRKWKYPLPGENHRFSITVVQNVLKEKLAHEAEHKRQPGHVSTVAPTFLTRKTLAMVIGSRKFLATNADLYLERYGLLRGQLIPLLTQIAGLAERKSRFKDTYIHCQVKEKQFYPGNFDALLQAIQGTKSKRMSTAQLEEYLSQSN